MLNKLPLHEVLTGGPDWKLQEMAAFMAEKQARHVFIMDDKEIGIISQSDIVFKAVAKGMIDVTAKDIMKKPVLAVAAECGAKEAYYTMLQYNLMSMPVIENNTIIGEVTLASAFEALKEQDGNQQGD